MNKKIENFIPRKYLDIENNDRCDFDSILENDISVILGEPASGKTYQLKFYYNQKENIKLEDIVNINYNEINVDNVEIILLDSIDEALKSNLSRDKKELQYKLTKYISKCKELNPKIKFILTSRQGEWYEYFSDKLNETYKSLKVYKILDLDDEQINTLLVVNKINNKEFWNFISINHLVFLLKNILVVQKIIANYDNYKTRMINYTDIYIDILKEHLTVKGKERDELSPDKLPTELIDMSSSLATYMLINKKDVILIDSISKLSDELYNINSKMITINDLNILLKTNLLEVEENYFHFFHKSAQEFLMAYFLNKKDLDFEELKKLFSHEMKFFEEFEEVIIYLTNLRSDFFEEILEFDPLIFKRHPSLDEEQQVKLLHTMLNNLQYEKSIIYGKWKYSDNNSLLNFKKLKNIHLIIKDKVDINNVDNVLFPYLIKLLNYNYTKELENEIFDILDKFNQLAKNQEKKVFTEEDRISENVIKGNVKTRELIEYSFVDNYNISIRLYDFIKSNQLLNTNIQNISMLNFETKLFESIYGIKYKNRYGSTKDVTCNYTDYDFEELIPLLSSIPYRDLKYIVPYLKQEDSLKWFDYIKIIKVNNKISLWAIYGLLLHDNSKEVISLIFEYLAQPQIYLHIENQDIEDMPFDFEIIADNFWEFYFQLDIDNDYRASNLIPLLQVSLVDIKKVSKIYTIKEYSKHYVRFRLNEDINHFLMSNRDFEIHMNELWEKQKEQQRKWDEDSQLRLEKSENYQNRKQQKENKENLCEKSLQSLTTKQDYYNVYYCEELYSENNEQKFDTLFNDEQKSQFFKFILEDLINDSSYLKQKENVCNRSVILHTSNLTPLYIFYLKNLDSNEILRYINTKEIYEKLYWHVLNSSNIDESFFIYLTENYFEYFIELFIETIQLSLEQSENKNIIYLQDFIITIEKLHRFNKETLNDLIELIKQFNINLFKTIESYNLGNILSILSLDINSYEFIENLTKLDNYKSSKYLDTLLKMDKEKALNGYLNMYSKEQKYIKRTCKEFFKELLKKEKTIHINEQKVHLLKNLIVSLKNLGDNDFIDDNCLKIIITDYYELLYQNEQEFSDTSRFINNLWNNLGVNTNRIPLLIDLLKSNKNKFYDIAKHILQNAYNQQQKERSKPNSYYKKIFDNKGNIETKTINVEGIYVDGNVDGNVKFVKNGH